jgi:hypothetical protein
MGFTYENPGETLRRYVLGELTKEEADRVEELYCTEDAWLTELLATRDDLLDDWACGELTATEQSTFLEQLQRLPALREHATFALEWQALRHSSQLPRQTSEQGISWWQLSRWQWTFVTMFMVIVFFGVGALWMRPRPDNTAQHLATVSSPQVSVTPSPEKTLPTVPRETLVVTSPATKTMPITKGQAQVLGLFLPLNIRTASADEASVPIVELSHKKTALHLQLEVPKSLTALAYLILQNDASQSLWKSALLQAQVQKEIHFVSCNVPISELSLGLYRVELHSADDQLITQTAFRVTSSTLK